MKSPPWFIFYSIMCFASAQQRSHDCKPSESIYGSVGFSIDNTGSVSSSATGVMSLSNGIIDKLVEDNYTIPRWVLTTFSDGQPYHVNHPDNTDLRIVTNDVNTFRYSLNSVTFSGGGDGPERATQGILLTLQNLPMHGVALVFTDHQTKDVDLLHEIIALRNQKKITVFIVLAPGYYGTIGDESWRAFDQISEGRIYNMADFTKEQFISEVVVIIGQTCEDNNCCKYKEVGGIYYDLIETPGFLGDPYSLSCLNRCFYKTFGAPKNVACFGSGSAGSGFEAHCLDDKKTTFPLYTTPLPKQTTVFHLKKK